MLLAKIENGNIISVSPAQVLFPTTSFPEEGPDAEFLAEMGAMNVDNSIVPAANQKLVEVPAYIDGDVVRTVSAINKTTEEIAQEAAASLTRQLSDLKNEARRRLDAFAQERGYDSIISVCTYDSSSVPSYAAEALIARTLRDQWWLDFHSILADITEGERPVPNNFEELIPELPALSWE